MFACEGRIQWTGELADIFPRVKRVGYHIACYAFFEGMIGVLFVQNGGRMPVGLEFHFGSAD